MTLGIVACVGGNPEPTPALNTIDGPDATTTTPGGGSSGTTPVEAGTDSGPSCAPGQQVCGASCVDTNTSAQHCGTCDRDCGGTTCSAGACAALTIQDGLATAPYGVTAVASRVFWVRDGAVEAKAGDGSTVGAATSISTDVVRPATITGTTIVAEGSFVAWLARNEGDNAVFTCSAVGCGGSWPKVGTSGSSLVQLALSGNRLFATPTFPGGAVRTCAMGQCFDAGFVGLAGSGVDPGVGIAANATDVYFTAGGDPTSGGTIRCPVEGCPSPISARTRLFANGELLALAGSVLVATTTDGTVVSCDAVNGCAGTAKLLAANQPNVVALVADTNNVYFAISGSTTSPTGEIRTCALPDCTGGARVLVPAQAQPVSLAIDGGFLYWANAGLNGQAPTTAAIRRVRL